MRLGGKSVSITRPTAKECAKAAELLKAEHRAGKVVLTPQTITLRKAIEKHIEERKNILSPSTIRGYNTIKDYRFADVADSPLSTINWQKEINKEAANVKPKTLANSWGLVSSVLKENNLPVPKVVLPQIVPDERPWLTPEQIPVFLDAVKGKPCEFPALLALHGLRRSEIYALTPDSFENDIIHVRGSVVFDEDEKQVVKKTNKNTSSRRDVPIMIPRLKEVLGSPMFDCPITNLGKSVNRICDDAGLPRVGVHGLRHSFASLCLHQGLSTRECMVLGGWSDAKTMQKIYQHISQDDLQKAQQKLKSFFGG